MFNDIFTAALENGLWAALFCLLFIYQLKDSRVREVKYCDTIKKLTAGIAGISVIKTDCERIKTDCKAIKRAVNAEKGEAAKSNEKGQKTQKEAGGELCKAI